MADKFKEQGNNAFKRGDFADAVDLFSEGLKLDPANHVLLSNRSAAYASLKTWNNALRDARKCVEIKPDWAKGYSRKAAAHIALGQFYAAVSTCQQGLERDPTNASLLTSLESAQAAADKSDGPNMQANAFASGDATRYDPEKDKLSEEDMKLDVIEMDGETDDLIDGLLDEILQQQQSDALERVLRQYLDPFRVLNLPPTASEEEAVAAYRKLSVLVHPDKNKDPRAINAFQLLKRIQKDLEDEDKLCYYRIVYEKAEELAAAEKRRKLKAEAKKEAKSDMKVDISKLRLAFKGKISDALEDGSAENDDNQSKDVELAVDEIRPWAAAILRDMEAKRIRSHELAIKRIEKEAEDMEKAKIEGQKKREMDKKWDNQRDVRVDSWRQWQQGGSKKRKFSGPSGLKPPKLKKEEQHQS